MECPKCSAEIKDNSVECPDCGIMIAKFLERAEAKRMAKFQKAAATPEPDRRKPSITVPVIMVMAVVAVIYYFYLETVLKPKAEAPEPAPAVVEEMVNEGTPEEFAEEKETEKLEVGEALEKIDKLVGAVPGGAARKKMAAGE